MKIDLSLLFNVTMDSIEEPKNPNLTKTEINYKSLATFELMRDDYKDSPIILECLDNIISYFRELIIEDKEYSSDIFIRLIDIVSLDNVDYSRMNRVVARALI